MTIATSYSFTVISSKINNCLEENQSKCICLFLSLKLNAHIAGANANANVDFDVDADVEFDKKNSKDAANTWTLVLGQSFDKSSY